jgi:hypothetical protein
VRFWSKFVLVVLFGSAGVSGKTLLEVFGKIFAAAGLLMLIKTWIGYLLGFPFGNFGALIIDTYDFFIDWILGCVQPIVSELVRLLLPGWELANHWKNVTTLTALYMSRSVINALFADLKFRDRQGRDHHWKGDRQCAAWRAGWGLTLALLAGAGVGLVAPPARQSMASWQHTLELATGGYLFVAAPVIAIALYQIGNGVFQAVFRKDLELHRRPKITNTFGIVLGFSTSAVERALDVLVAPRRPAGVLFNAPLWLTAAIALQIQSPGFVALFAFICYLGWVFASEGKEQAVESVPRFANISDWREVYFEQGSSKIGTSILGALAWMFLLYIADRFVDIDLSALT